MRLYIIPLMAVVVGQQEIGKVRLKRSEVENSKRSDTLDHGCAKRVAMTITISIQCTGYSFVANNVH